MALERILTDTDTDSDSDSSESIDSTSSYDKKEEQYLYEDELGTDEVLDDDIHITDKNYRSYLRWLEQDEKNNHAYFIDDDE